MNDKAGKHSGDNIARYITTPLEWSDLVLDDATRGDVEDIATWLRHSHTLMEDWKLAGRAKPGWRSLFMGPPGTGKRLTALLIGKTAGCDVYRVDLFRLASKEAEEEDAALDALLAQAQAENWILLVELDGTFFDERDNDRAANQQIAYLLQRLEDFPGVVIVASNLAALADEAFARRFESVIHFPVPTVAERVRLWKDASAGVPRADDVDFEKLARDYELSGGAIATALRAACLRAFHRDPPSVTMADLEAAIKRRPRAAG